MHVNFFSHYMASYLVPSFWGVIFCIELGIFKYTYIIRYRQTLRKKSKYAYVTLLVY